MHSISVAVLLSLVQGSLSSNGYLQLEVTRRNPSPLRLMRRANGANSIDTPLIQWSNKLEYLVNITVGTPGQPLAVTLDTGSSDLWIPASTSQLCSSGQCDAGMFNPSDSSTYQIVQEGGFNISYASPGDYDAGDWATDTVSIGGSSGIAQQQIGVALEGVDPHGVMGVGYDTNESQNEEPNNVYPSIMDNLVTQSLIQRKAFSLYLNDYQAEQGSIIFGGIDTTKYTGDLTVLPLQADNQGGITSYFVTLTGVSFTDETGHVSQLSPAGYAQSMLLDSGTSSTLLTSDVLEQIANGFGAVDIGDQNYLVPCRFANINGNFTYTFGGDGGPTVDVPVSQVIGAQEASPDQFADESGGCQFGFEPPIGGIVILGDTFLRNAYVVFDIENGQVAIAQAALNQTTTSSIVVIPSGTSIPGATVTASATGTQLDQTAATSMPAIPTASMMGTSLVLAGTPTFNLGVSSTASASSTSEGAAFRVAPTAALLGLGIAAGLAAW